jgi:outer membrane protein
MTQQFKTTIKIAAFAVAAALSSTSFAQVSGDDIVSAGWFHFQPNSSSTPLSVTLPGQAPTELPGSGASVDKTDTIGFSWTHFWTTHWAGSLDLGIPPTYKLEGTGSFAGVGQLGQAKQWAPTVVGKYYFLGADETFRPFLGLGVSHVSYKDISLTSNFQGAIQQELLLASQGLLQASGTTASIDSKWVPVYSAGASYRIDRKWYAGLSLSYLPLKNTADLTTTTNYGPVHSNTSIKIDPLVTYLTIGYRF